MKTQPAEFAENFVQEVDFKLANFKNFIDARTKFIREKLTEKLKAHGIIYFGAEKISSDNQNILPANLSMKLLNLRGNLKIF